MSSDLNGLKFSNIFYKKPSILQNITNTKRTNTNDNFVLEKDEQNGAKTPPPSTGLEDAFSPNANLRMLIRAISPELKSRDCNDINEWADQYVDDFPQMQQLSNQMKDRDSIYYIRSAKSLNLLCKKFLALYPETPHNLTTLQIDQVARHLGVERRRIYDIINILESLNMVTKLGKNTYEWHGNLYLLTCLKKIKDLGPNYLSHFEKETRLFFSNNNKENNNENGNKNNNRHSLGILSQKFLMNLLVAKDQMMYMEDMARIIDDEELFNKSKSCPDFDLKKPKTRTRRLYDIANVLSSLKLVEKIRVKTSFGNRPAFYYIGPDLSSVKFELKPINDISPLQSRHSLFRHATFNALTPILTKKEKCENSDIFNTPTSTTTTLPLSQKEFTVLSSKLKYDFANIGSGLLSSNVLPNIHMYPTPGSGTKNSVNQPCDWLTPIQRNSDEVTSKAQSTNGFPLTPLTDSKENLCKILQINQFTPQKRKFTTGDNNGAYTKRLFLSSVQEQETSQAAQEVDNNDKRTQTSVHASPFKSCNDAELLKWQACKPIVELNKLVSVDDLKLLDPRLRCEAGFKRKSPSGLLPTLQFIITNPLKLLSPYTGTSASKLAQQNVTSFVSIKPKPVDEIRDEAILEI